MTTTLYVSNNPPVKNAAFTFSAILFSQADPKIFKLTPTLAAGDITVSIDDGAHWANITSLPASTAGGELIVALTAAEHNGNRVMVRFHDVAGAEWCDLLVCWSTVNAVTVASVDPTTPPTAAAVADAVWDEVITSGHAIADSAAVKLVAVPTGVAPTASQNADAVWDEMMSGHTAAGSAGDYMADVAALGDPWAAPVRTLTSSAAATLAAITGSTLVIQRGDTYDSPPLTGLAPNTGYVSIDFTVKESTSDSDTKAILRIRKNASGANDGLLTLNAETVDTIGTVTAADGAIAVNSATSLTISLSAAASRLLSPARGLYYDIQYIFAGGRVVTATAKDCAIVADITRAVA